MNFEMSIKNKPDMDKLPGKIGARFEKFWKLYVPVMKSIEKKKPVDSRMLRAAYDDARRAYRPFMNIAERSRKYQPKEVQEALFLAYYHIDNMETIGLDLLKNNYKPRRAKRGDSGRTVKAYQELLKFWKHYDKKIDGDYGEATEAAVKEFQKRFNLKVNGRIDSKTAAEFVRSGLSEGKEKTVRKLCK